MKAIEEKSTDIFKDRSFPLVKTLDIYTLGAKRIESNLMLIKIKLSKLKESQIELDGRSKKIIDKLNRINKVVRY